MFLVAPVYEGTIEDIYCECDGTSVRYIYGMFCITICVKEVRIFLIFYLCIYFFEVILVGALVSFISFLP